MARNYPGLSPIAVVVSLFNPPSEVVERCTGWMRDIGPVVAVDDGSPRLGASQVLEALKSNGVTVLRNHRNSGIATALNVGIRRALDDFDPAWILTMDQDSELADDYLVSAQSTLTTTATPDQIGMLCAEWLGDVRLPTEVDHDGVELVTDPIQSGMLMRSSMFQSVGLFDETLVIDCVDSEYAARAASQDWKAAGIGNGRLRHSLGETIPLVVRGHRVSLFGRPRNVIYHAPFRTYYATRNQFIMARRFWRSQPRRVLRKVLENGRSQVLLALGAPDQRQQRTAICLGFRAAMKGEAGRISDSDALRIGLKPSNDGDNPAIINNDAGRVKSVQVLLSTWNGADYLSELLDSLISQKTGVNVRVLIRDDGSTDETVSIIKKYLADNPSWHLEEGENVGVNESFRRLLELADPKVDVYFFCDQDDVWFPDKIQVAVDALAKSDNTGVPLLYGSRSMITDGQLNPLGPTTDPREVSFANALVMNFAPGHTMAFNRTLLEKAVRVWDSSRILYFDHWMYLIASAYGEVILDRGWHCFYRNHEGNAVGYSRGALAIQMARVKMLLSQDFRTYTRQARALRGDPELMISQDNRARLDGFVVQGSALQRLKYIVKFRIHQSSYLTSAVAGLLFVVGRYKL